MRIYLLSSNGKPFTTLTPARSLKHACQVQPVLAEGRGLEPQSRRTALFSKQARRPGRFAFQNFMDQSPQQIFFLVSVLDLQSCGFPTYPKNWRLFLAPGHP